VATTPSAFKSAAQAGRSCVTWRRRAPDCALRPLSKVWIDDGAAPSSPPRVASATAMAGTPAPIIKIMLARLAVGSTWVPSRLLVAVRGFLGASGCCPVAQLLYHARVPPAPRHVPPEPGEFAAWQIWTVVPHLFVRRHVWLGVS
jgi:hypothetical protein